MVNKLSDMNDWNYHKNEFIKLGGIVENLTCREGATAEEYSELEITASPKSYAQRTSY